jgi:predicted amidohydrolase
MFAQSSFLDGGKPWRPQAAREEVLPDCAVDSRVSRAGENGSLRIKCQHRVQYGGWTHSQEGINAGSWYRFDAHYLADGVTEERRTVVARLTWRNAAGDPAGQPEYVYHTEEAGGGWRHVWALAPAPEGATQVRLELLFGWSPGGTVWWDDIMLAEAEALPPRPVKIAALYHRPGGNSSAQANVEEFCEWIDKAAEESPDIICLPEGITIIGTGLTMEQVAEPIPGPTSRRLGELARKHNCYIEACYNERDGQAVYNTAILIDRSGELLGKYRKLYVPREEIEGGVTPGRDVPVFDTDFGRVGMMICWDAQYVEPAQRLALGGAEVILLPIWGGHETLIKARAIENQVFMVTSGYDVPSWIIAPDGKILAEASGQDGKEGAIATAEIDLNRRYEDPWVGNVRARFLKEHREDLR